MFSHIMLGANDLEISKIFYDATLGALGKKPGVVHENRCYYRSPVGVLILTKPIDGGLATSANGDTVGFISKSIEDVDAFFSLGIANGGSICEGTPGYRDGVAGRVYITWLRDPVGNKVCAMHRLQK